MIIWEPEWHDRGSPEVGEYVQIKWEYEATGESGVHEGLVTRVDEALIYTCPPHAGDLTNHHPDALAWRKGALAEFKGELRMAEEPA
jgi:hypothetical protein